MVIKAEITPIPELQHLKGGKKHHWLRIHHDELVEFHAEHGDKATMKRYGFKLRTTLLNNLRPIQTIPENMTKAEKAIYMAEIAVESGRQTRQEIRELRHDFNQFVPQVAGSVTALLVKAFQSIELPDSLEYKQTDPLALADFQGSEDK